MQLPRTSAAQSGPFWNWFCPPPGWKLTMNTIAIAMTARPPRRDERRFTVGAPGLKVPLAWRPDWLTEMRPTFSHVLCSGTVSRRSATPSEVPPPGLPPTRRQAGGSRREASDRIQVEVACRSIDGWALNVSRGGVRVILDEALQPGTMVRVAVGEQPARDGRVVW